MIKDFFKIIKFLLNQKKYKRIFFFENIFIENHLFSYLSKNKNISDTVIVSLYNLDSNKFKNFQYYSFNNYISIEFIFLLLKIRFCYSSTPDLDFNAFRKSLLKKTKYIYIQHSPVSLSMIYNIKAFIKFNIVQVVNKSQFDELKQINNFENKKIKGWKYRYLFFDKQKKFSKLSNIKKKILIAPTWGTDFYKNSIHLKILKMINKDQFEIYLRPHPMSLKKKDIHLDLISKDFNIDSNELNFMNYDILISDWSGIYIEFAKVRNLKAILINTSKKIINKDYLKFKNQAIEIEARDKLGIILDPNNIHNINETINIILTNEEKNKILINNFFKENFY